MAVVAPSGYRFPRSHRLSGKLAFAAVFDARVRKNVGPLGVAGRLNGLPHNRLGLSVSRRVGNAVRRNRMKRLLREAFRLNQHAWPTGMDLVVVVRPHQPQGLGDYARMLGMAVESLSRELRRRERRAVEQGD